MITITLNPSDSLWWVADPWQAHIQGTDITRDGISILDAVEAAIMAWEDSE